MTVSYESVMEAKQNNIVILNCLGGNVISDKRYEEIQSIYL